MATGEKEESALLSEMFTKAVYSILIFIYERFVLTGLSLIITKTAGTTVYGYISVVIRAEITITRLAGGVTVANLRTIPRTDKFGKRRVASLSILLVLFVWFLISSLTILFQDRVIRHTTLEPRHQTLVLVSLLIFLSGVLLIHANSIYKAEKDIRKALFFTKILKPSAYFIGCISVILLFSTVNANLLAVGISVVSIISGVFGVYSAQNRHGFTSDLGLRTSEIKNHLWYMYDASIVSVLGVFHRNIVFVLMAVIVSPVAAGLFSLGLILSKAGRWPLRGINKIFPPIASNLYSNDQSSTLDSLYKSSSTVATFFSTIPFFYVVSFHTEIMSLFSPEYASDSIVLPILYVSEIFATFIGSVGLLLLMTDNERPSVYVGFSNALLMVPISIILTLEFGVVGLATSFLFTMFYNNGAELIVLYYLEDLNPITKNDVHMLGIMTTLSVLCVFVTQNILGLGMSIIFVTIITLVYSASAYVTILDSDEKEALENIVRSISILRIRNK